MSEIKNPHGLSPEELSVLHFWQNGDTMTEAYRRVMISKYDAANISDSALKKRVLRFFNTYRMREAMADTPGERGDKARADFEKWKATQKAETIRQLLPEAAPKFEDKLYPTKKNSQTDIPSQDEDTSDDATEDYSSESETFAADDNSDEQVNEYSNNGSDNRSHNGNRKQSGTSYFDKIVKPQLERFNQANVQPPSSFDSDKYKTDREKWLASLNINQNPTAMTIYGTGQYLAYVAVKEIMARQQAIKENNIPVLSKNGSALTPTIISALKTAAAMVLPFAPAPTVEDRKEMTKAAVLLGLMPESISESPDDYTAPMPTTIEVDD
jgi:hypothetical protein